MPRISLRQLLLLTAVVALAIVSLKYAGTFWQGLIGLFAMLALFAAIILAIYERGPRQAFAIGFAVVVVGYHLLFLTGGRLPTYLLLDRLYRAIAKPGSYDVATGQRVSDTQAAAIKGNTANWTNLGTPPVATQDYPEQLYYYPVGNYWWTLLLDYLGGLFARWAYLQRANEKSSQAKE